MKNNNITSHLLFSPNNSNNRRNNKQSSSSGTPFSIVEPNNDEKSNDGRGSIDESSHEGDEQSILSHTLYQIEQPTLHDIFSLSSDQSNLELFRHTLLKVPCANMTNFSDNVTSLSNDKLKEIADEICNFKNKLKEKLGREKLDKILSGDEDGVFTKIWDYICHIVQKMINTISRGKFGEGQSTMEIKNNLKEYGFVRQIIAEKIYIEGQNQITGNF